MNDRELLEMAAKAAGYSGAWIKWPGARHPLDVELGFFHGSDGSVWNPFASDGDALRLASKIMLTVEFGNNCVIWSIEVNGEGHDPLIATRRAIVRAAAEIGRTMKE